MSFRSPELVAVLDKVGGHAKLASMIGVTRAAVHQWRCIPLDRVLEIEEATGVPREKLRPDVFAAPRPKRGKAA